MDCGVDISGRGNRAKRCEIHAKEAIRIWHKARDKARYAAHHEEMNAKSKAHYAKYAKKINAQAKAYRAAHPEKQKARKKLYYAAHYEEINAQAKAWHAAHPEKTKAARKKWQAENPEQNKACKKLWKKSNLKKVNTTRRAYYAAHPEVARARRREWGAANPEKVKAMSKAYLAEHPEKYRAYANKRRARKLNQLGVVSKGISLRLLASQEYRCVTCETDIRPPQPYHLDHIIPLARGGMHEDSNLQCLCPTCNLSKGAKLPAEWAEVNHFREETWTQE